MFDLIRKCGGEQQSLACVIFWQQSHHFADVMDEAHIQHAVCFVQHQYLDLRQVYGLLADVIQQSARCCHQDVDALSKLRYLGIDLYATEDDGGF